MADPLLSIEHLSVQFNARGRTVRALSDISYSLTAGEVLALVGESGSGKTVSALAILGLLPPESARITSGSIRFEGRELVGQSDTELQRIRGHRIAMIFQDPQTSLNPVLTVGRQITEVVERHLGLPKKPARRRAIELLKIVGVGDAERRIDDYPHQFSGGMRQRVMIAAAISCDPAMLIADEPTTALDVTIQAQVLDVLRRLRTELGMAVLIITHDLGVVAGFADRVGVMYAGQIAEIGPTRRLLSEPTHPYTVGLLRAVPRIDLPRGTGLLPIEGSPPDLTALGPGCPFEPRCAWRLDVCAVKNPPLTLTGRPTDELDEPRRLSACHNRPTRAEALLGVPLLPVDGAIAAESENPTTRGPQEGGTPAEITPVTDLVRVDDLSVYFPFLGGLLHRQVGWVRAVDGVTLAVKRGETLGLVGESGSGKTTLGRLLVRLVPAHRGRVEFDGEDLLGLKGEELRGRRRRFQMVFQDPHASLDPRMNVRQILSEPLDIHSISTGRSRAPRIAELLRIVGLDPSFVDRYPHEFSGGQRQRLGIARALAVEPDFLVCDEAVSALDVSIRAQVIALLERLQAELGLTYLFIAHDLAVVRHIADRVAVMYLGKIVEAGLTDEIYTGPQHPYTAALLSAIPIPDVEAEHSRARIILSGDPPSPLEAPTGCPFHTRCWLRPLLGNPEVCETSVPEMPAVEVAGSRGAACHFADETAEAFRTSQVPA